MDKKLTHKEVLKIVKRNEAQDLLNNFTAYASKNTENIIIALVAVIVITVGVPLYMKSRGDAEIKAQQILAKANFFLTRPISDKKEAQMYGMFRTNEEKYEKAIAAYNEVVQTYKGSKSLPYAYLGIADAYYNYGKYKEALEYFNTFIERYPKHYLAPEALTGRACTNFELGDYKGALDDLKNVTTNFADSYVANDARLKQAECYVRLTDTADAKLVYGKILSDSKDSYWAGVAKEKLKEIQ
jgi:tetratricopeptide (TPR) repeat protein